MKAYIITIKKVCKQLLVNDSAIEVVDLSFKGNSLTTQVVTSKTKVHQLLRYAFNYTESSEVSSNKFKTSYSNLCKQLNRLDYQIDKLSFKSTDKQRLNSVDVQDVMHENIESVVDIEVSIQHAPHDCLHGAEETVHMIEI